jgi:hypothetical protein
MPESIGVLHQSAFYLMVIDSTSAIS